MANPSQFRYTSYPAAVCDAGGSSTLLFFALPGSSVAVSTVLELFTSLFTHYTLMDCYEITYTDGHDHETATTTMQFSFSPYLPPLVFASLFALVLNHGTRKLIFNSTTALRVTIFPSSYVDRKIRYVCKYTTSVARTKFFEKYVAAAHQHTSPPNNNIIVIKVVVFRYSIFSFGRLSFTRFSCGTV